ncbi:MAG: 3-isopropylmalate dehydratase small subunit, partial [Halodesulfurarchaeum sp.]
GQYAFHDQRFDESGEPTDHPFNQSRFADASVLAVNANFGTGSSREHAPQALARWGIDAIVGESFAEIFAGNCLALGIPTARAEPGVVGALQDWIEANPGSPIAVDVAGETVSFGEQTEPVSFGETARRTLLEGVWDTTAVMRDNLEAVRDVARSLPYVDDGPGGTATDD